MTKAELLHRVHSWQEQLDAEITKLPKSVFPGKDQDPVIPFDQERQQAERAGEYVSVVGLIQFLETLKEEIDTLPAEVEKAQKQGE